MRWALLLPVLLVAASAAAQEPPKPSVPCVRSASSMVMAGIDPEFERCKELVLMEQIFALVSKVTQLEVELRLMKSEKRAAGVAEAK